MDQENLDAFLKINNKPSPQFIREIADKTLLIGLTSTVLRDAKFTSHAVYIDSDQVQWFKQVLNDHPSHKGWKVLVFTHVLPIGSGLKVLPENHVVNGCCWLNHSNEQESSQFNQLVPHHTWTKLSRFHYFPVR
jgi:hypothetical protein